MASHIAVLWTITALGCLDLHATRWLQAPADSALPRGFSQVWKFAPTGQGRGATDVSPARVLVSETMAQRSAGPDMPAVRPPVPFLRQPRPASSSPLQPEVPEAAAEEESQDALDMEAAKAAIERDGHKRVMLLGKASNGAWRAKAYRGVAEVFLTVGSDGTVSAE